ncbi:histidine kinase [Streptomyces sp. H10-C2]|uniref:sensor histidine kinase n=1 Tax=unclassified Streptomyces TaxID=2593676 RepID=UPI0024BB8565|nr:MULTISPECIES: histidine kinase [unclassified Streptomyces]MDJ0343931.1 histidine kinase [Streptomyces sp. PH10-H1]MDJ0373372.1 histidine kinase [Streptomyces sp. H10-C2]
MTNEDPLWGHPVVARLMRGGRRLLREDQNRPWLVNTSLVVVVLLVFGLPDLLRLGDRHEALQVAGLSWGWVLALQLGLTLPLLWRRTAPSAVFAAVTAVFFLQWILDVWLHIDIALFIALYGMARRGRLRHLPWACGITVVALVLVALRVSTVVSPLVALFFLGSAATAAAALGLAVRIGQAYLAALRDRAARLETERDQQSKLATAAERARVAREMHDIIGHNLSVIISLADGGAYAADLAPGRSKEALQLISGTSRQALGELRRMLGMLREDPGAAPQRPTLELSPQPGIGDLDALCDRVRSAGPEVVYRTVGDLEAVEPGVQLAVYRIVQESLTNILKHAGTDTQAQLTVASEGGKIRIRVEDTGPPNGPRYPLGSGARRTGTQRTSQEGHGISGMSERAALYGGTVAAGPRPGGGWTVESVLDPGPLPVPAPSRQGGGS